jgi:hypothetical protein
MLLKFSQVKLSNVGTSTIISLFKVFRIKQALKSTKMNKAKGYSIIEMLTVLLLLILQSNKSIYHGLASLFATKMKTPINDLINNENYNWRNFLYFIAKRFMVLCTPETDAYLIFDDTAKEKTGNRGEFLMWFKNHSQNRHFKGFQNITMSWFNGKTVIPVDFEMKIGTSKVKHSKKGKYCKGTHIEQRVRFSKKKKNDIVIQMLKRALKRKIKYRFVLWDSWFNSSKTISYVFTQLVPKGKILISMLKNNNIKYRFDTNNKTYFLSLKELKNRAGKWIIDSDTGIKHKVITVSYLDVKSSTKIPKRQIVGNVRIAFFKYPNVKRFKAIVSTNTEFTAMEILEHYLKRWSIECLFKDIKQYFGYNQNKASKYSSLVGDISIRYAFYILFCYKKEQANNQLAKERISTEQIMLEFYQELFEICLNQFIEIMLKRKLKQFLEYAQKIGIKNIDEAIAKADNLIEVFFRSEYYADKIEELPNKRKNNKILKLS